MNKPLVYILSLLFISTLLVQCKAKKPLLDTEEGKIYHFSKTQADTIVREVLMNNFEFDNLKAKIKTKFKSREKQNLILGTFLKIKKDSVIHATISVLGFPAVVALITPDSLKFINKKDKKYFEGDFSYVSQLLNTEITFAQLQDLLVGNPIKMDSNYAHTLIQENEEFFIHPLSQTQLNTDENSDDWKVKFWINELFKAGKTIVSSENRETQIEIFQADYNKTEGQLFPNRTKVEVITPKDSISILLNYQRVKINTEMDFDFSIPDNYTKYD